MGTTDKRHLDLRAKATGESDVGARLRLHHDPCEVAGVQSRNRNSGLQEPRSTLEEHLSDRDEVELLWTFRPGEDVRAPQVVLFALRLRPSVLVENGREPRLAEALDVPDIVLPGGRPADIIDEPPRLPEGEVDAGDPGPRARERSFEVHKGGQRTRHQRPKHVAFQAAVPAGDRLSAARSAREIDAMDIHEGRAGWTMVVNVRERHHYAPRERVS